MGGGQSHRLNGTEWALLRSLVLRRSPELLPLIEVAMERLLTQPEREDLRLVVATELMEFGYLKTPGSDRYGFALDDLIASLGEASEWPDGE